MNKEALNQFLSEIGRRKNKKPENDEKRKEQAKINILKANEARRKKKQPVLDDTNNENENPFSDGPKDILAPQISKVKKYDELKNEIQEMKSMFNSYLEGKKRKQEVKHEEKKQEAMVKNVVLTHLPNMLSQYKAHDVGPDASRTSSILKLSKQLEDNKMNILSKIIK